MTHKKFKRIMIFGRPGSGKSTFALWLANAFNLPLHHLDKHFFVADWAPRDYDEFLEIQRDIIITDSWIVDGNNPTSFEMRFDRADLVLYFNYPRMICYFRILKRFFQSSRTADDIPPGCDEVIQWVFLKYTWTFAKRVEKEIAFFKEKYPHKVFREIKSNADLEGLKQELVEN
jgi:adenylate kinase family enzyme